MADHTPNAPVFVNIMDNSTEALDLTIKMNDKPTEIELQDANNTALYYSANKVRSFSRTKG